MRKSMVYYTAAVLKALGVDRWTPHKERGVLKRIDIAGGNLDTSLHLDLYLESLYSWF